MNLNHRGRPAAARRMPAEKPAGSELQTRFNRAVALGKGFEAIGDTVAAERFYQQADHFRRLLNSKPSQFSATAI